MSGEVTVDMVAQVRAELEQAGLIHHVPKSARRVETPDPPEPVDYSWVNDAEHYCRCDELGRWYWTWGDEFIVVHPSGRRHKIERLGVLEERALRSVVDARSLEG